MYGPGRSFIALKQRHVSSTSTGPLICRCLVSEGMDSNEQKGLRTASAARRHLSVVTSSTVPWISTRSMFWFLSSMTPSRMAWTYIPHTVSR